MMATYAANTSVSVSQSQMEVERTLERYGATKFMRGWDENQAVIAFQYQNRQVRMILPLPSRDEFLFTDTVKRRTSQNAINEAYEQACRQRWRALALVVKAKLEAVESGISTFEQEFMAHILLPNGQTTGQWMIPQIEAAYQTGAMPALLPMLAAPKQGGE